MLSKVYFTTVLFFYIVLGLRDFVSNRVYVKRQILEKLSRNSDLIKYLDALNRLIDFSIEHENDIDISFYFGLFLVNVNFKRVLREKQDLPRELHTDLKEIIRNTENLLQVFKDRVQQHHHLHHSKYKIILSLFNNATTWVNRLPKFHTAFLNTTVSSSSPYNVNTKWILYRKNVDDRNAWVPSPQQSDVCLTSLAAAEEVQIGASWRCRVLKICNEIVENGTDFGYALAHRLLFLQQARFARSCNVFSEQEDEKMRRRFCSLAYQEAEYIARHNFEIVDLLLEHVCLCSLEGYAQFVKRSWLTQILRFQMPQGCFSHILYRSNTPYLQKRNRRNYKSYPTIEGYCNGHTTAVAAGALAMASRFILQFYY